MLIRKMFVYWKGVLGFPISREPRQMIGYDIFDPFLITNFNMELLQQEDPSDESWFHIGLTQEVLKCGVIGVYDNK